jgi:hypothetical protein
MSWGRRLPTSLAEAAKSGAQAGLRSLACLCRRPRSIRQRYKLTRPTTRQSKCIAKRDGQVAALIPIANICAEDGLPGKCEPQANAVAV